MKKVLTKIICLLVIFSLLFSSSPFILSVSGKCDDDDTKCKLKKQADKKCKDADNVDGCKMERKTAQDKLNDIAQQKQAGMAPVVSPKETDPEKAGDTAWASCASACDTNDRGCYDQCRGRAEQSYLEVEKDHPVDPFTKEQHIVRDALRDTALRSSIEQGGALTYEQAERIRQESDLAAKAEPKPEFREQFANQVIQQYGQAALSLSGEQLNQLIENYCQQNQGACKTTIGQETDLTKMGQDLLNKASVSLYLEEEKKEEEAARTAAEAEARRKAEEKAKQQVQVAVQQAVRDACQVGSPTVQIPDAGEYSGWYNCKTQKKISDKEASKLQAQYKHELLLAQAKAKEKIKFKGILSQEIKMGQSGGTNGTSSTGPSQDSLFACTASPEQIKVTGKLLETMAADYLKRQQENPIADSDGDGVLNYDDCDPNNASYQGDCPGMNWKPSPRSVQTTVNNLQIKGIITYNGQLAASNVYLEVRNPKTNRYEKTEVEFDRWGQFTSNSFSTYVGQMAEPVLLSATVMMNGQPRRVIVPLNLNEDGSLPVQNILLENYNVGMEEKLIEQIRKNYGIQIKNGPNEEDIWTAKEVQLIEDTLSELPSIFWQTETTTFVRDAGLDASGLASHLAPHPLVSLVKTIFRTEVEPNTVTMYDGIHSLTQATWARPSVKYTTESTFNQALIHELTHAIQYHEPAKNTSPEWDMAHPEVANWTTNLPPSLLINAYENPLVQDYMDIAGWEIDASTAYTFQGFAPSINLVGEGYLNAPTFYSKLNPLDDMADSAMLYVTNPDYLRERSPERYNWIRDNLFDGREYTSPQGNNNFFDQFVEKISLVLPKFRALAQTTQFPTPLEKLENIKPNMSREEVLNNLSSPVKERSILEYTFLSYPSSNPQIAHVIVLKNNRVVFIDIYKGKENPEKLSEYIERFGEPEKTTFSYFAQGAKVLIFTRQGIALIVLGDSEYVAKKQIFSPVSIEKFLSTLGKNLPLSDPFDQVGASNPGTPENTFEIKEGWNLIAFPFVPSDVWSASDLVTDIARQGGYITSVTRWNNGRWEAYIQRGDQPYGQDFPLEPGVGYMLRGHLPVNWVASGYQITSSLPLSLKKGYNLVGVISPNSYSAATTIDAINSSTHEETARTVTRFESGLYEPLVKQKGEVYGEDYPIEKTRGYFIRVEEDTNWTP